MAVWLGLAAVFICLPAWAGSANVPFLEQGFQFDYTPTGQPVPIPTTVQCDTIPLSWSRAAFTTGPNPQAPYYIQVYTSTFIFPSVIGVGSGLQYDWPVPYIPGTQYQICMFDSNGVSGGCQRMTTVIPVANSTLEIAPICTNLTYPAGILDVEAIDHTGTLSQYGWVDQCTDISVRPQNGTAPFILTIAPALHPPWNITSDDMNFINWTVELSWGSSFFISLVDANGQTWAFGPLHSGGQGPTDCLSLSGSSSDGDVQKGIAIGSGLGGLIAGVAIGGSAAWFFCQRRHRKYYEPYAAHANLNEFGKHGTTMESDALLSPGTHVANPSEQTSESRTSTGRNHGYLAPGSAYEIEPFPMPDSSSDTSPPRNAATVSSTTAQPAVSPVSQTHAENLLDSPPVGSDRSPSGQRAMASSGQVYVIHHDGGRAPVTVYTSEGAEVIELPPRYNPDDRPVDQPRTSESTQRKATRLPGRNTVNR